MKRIQIFLSMLCALWPFAVEAKECIAITQIVEHAALNETRRGVLDELQSQGFDARTTDILYQNAQGSIATAKQIAQHMASHNPAVLLAISTSSTQAAMAVCNEKEIPLVFASVTDPVACHFIDADGYGSITGVSNYIDVKKQLKFFCSLLPHLKNLGILYNPSEVNSVSLLKKTADAAEALGVQLHLAAAYRTSDVPAAARSLCGKVDAIFINNDNTVISAFDAVAKICDSTHLPLFCSDIDFISRGALAALGCNQYQLGRQAGAMAAEIIRGESATEIATQWPLCVECHINGDVAQKCGLQLPPDLLSSALIWKKEK